MTTLGFTGRAQPSPREACGAARRLGVIGMSAAMSYGCALSGGGAVAQSFHPDTATQIGLHASGMGSISVFDSDAELAVGAESQVLQRARGGGGTKWGDWRLRSLIGVTQMPRPHEPRLGYEGFLTLGAGRYRVGTTADVDFTWGAIGGLPIRLSAYEPPWRADDLIGLQAYLVPSLGVSARELEGLEANFTLSIRSALWSAFTP